MQLGDQNSFLMHEKPFCTPNPQQLKEKYHGTVQNAGQKAK